MSQGGDDDDTDKPHEATQKKLDDARKKGEIPRSTDLNTAAAYAGLLLAAITFGGDALIGFASGLQVMLDQSDSLARIMLRPGSTALAGGLLGRVAGSLLPWILLPIILVLVSILAQRSFTVAPTKLSPKLSRISPLANLKNKFGRNGLFEFFKSFVKLVIYSVILGLFLSTQMSDLLSTLHLGPGIVVAIMAMMTLKFLFVVLLVAASIGAIDFLWQRAEHLRRHRMSQREMTEETKQAEGDPHMKGKRRQRAYDIAMNQMLKDVPTADVVIVNPTHYAVALHWSRDKGSAPVCVAKGVDEIAAKIRELALASNVPIQRDPPTARALHASVEIGHEIPRDHYKAVAAAIRFAEQMRRRRRGSA